MPLILAVPLTAPTQATCGSLRDHLYQTNMDDALDGSPALPAVYGYPSSRDTPKPAAKDGAAKIAWGPFLQNLIPTGVSVIVAGKMSSCMVEYGEAADKLDKSVNVADSSGGVTITGLTPDKMPGPGNNQCYAFTWGNARIIRVNTKAARGIELTRNLMCSCGVLRERRGPASLLGKCLGRVGRGGQRPVPWRESPVQSSGNAQPGSRHLTLWTVVRMGNPEPAASHPNKSPRTNSGNQPDARRQGSNSTDHTPKAIFLSSA